MDHSKAVDPSTLSSTVPNDATAARGNALLPSITVRFQIPAVRDPYGQQLMAFVVPFEDGKRSE